MGREGVAAETTAVKAELGGIRSASKASAGTGWLALSELRFSERLAGPSYEAAQSARPRRAGEPDHAMCQLSPASAHWALLLRVGKTYTSGCHPPQHKTVVGETTGVTLSDTIVDATKGTPRHLETRV